MSTTQPDTQLIFTENPGSLPASYTADTDIGIQSILARIDGSGAAGNFLPTISIYSQDGKLIARVPSDITYAPGDTGVVSWTPFLARRVSAAPVGGAPVEQAFISNTTGIVAPGGFHTVPIDGFSRTNSSVFCTSATAGAACNNTSGDLALRCTGAGIYWFWVVSAWSGAGAAQSAAGLGSGGLHQAAESGLTSTFNNSTAYQLVIRIESGGGPGWFAPNCGDGGSGNDLQEYDCYATYFPGADEVLVF